MPREVLLQGTATGFESCGHRPRCQPECLLPGRRGGHAGRVARARWPVRPVTPGPPPQVRGVSGLQAADIPEPGWKAPTATVSPRAGRRQTFQWPRRGESPPGEAARGTLTQFFRTSPASARRPCRRARSGLILSVSHPALNPVRFWWRERHGSACQCLKALSPPALCWGFRRPGAGRPGPPQSALGLSPLTWLPVCRRRTVPFEASACGEGDT